MRSRIAILGGAALMALGAGRAPAATFTETVNFPGPGSTVGTLDFVNATGTTAGPNGDQLYLFDTNGGTLSSITFSYAYAFSSQITVSASGPASGAVRTESGVQFGSDRSGVTAALNRVVNTEAAGISFGGRTLAAIGADLLGNASSYNFSTGGGSTTFTSQASASTSFTDTNAADLAAFSQAGGGVFTPVVSTLTGLLVTSSGGNAQASQSAVANGSLTIAYNYQTPSGPPPAVPEPATWAMTLAGFAVVGGALRRRRPAMRVTPA